MRKLHDIFSDYLNLMDHFPQFFRDLLEQAAETSPSNASRDAFSPSAQLLAHSGRHKTRNFLFKAIGKGSKVDSEEKARLIAALQPYRQQIELELVSWASCRISIDPYNILLGLTPADSVISHLPFLQTITEMTKQQAAWHKSQAGSYS